MRRRQGFTLVELLVAIALIILIMVILSETFAAAMNSFQQLKAVGDMEEHLRTAATVLRRDLVADHFEGKRRTSDWWFWTGGPSDPTGKYQGPPRNGFFRVFKDTTLITTEGVDDYNYPCRRCVGDVLHFSVKLRGNELKDFGVGNIGGSLAGKRTTFFNQPAGYQSYGSLYSTQWLEVAYFMAPLTDQNNQPLQTFGTSGSAARLYGLYRCQYVVMADNTSLNWPPIGGALGAGTYEVSCQPGTGGLYYNSPEDLAWDKPPVPKTPSQANPNFPRKRAFQWPAFPESGSAPQPRGQFTPANPAPWAATLLLTNCLSFDVTIVRQSWNSGSENPFADGYNNTSGNTTPVSPFVDKSFESIDKAYNLINPASSTINNYYAPTAIKIILRIWDNKTQLTRQMTIVQEL